MHSVVIKSSSNMTRCSYKRGWMCCSSLIVDVNVVGRRWMRRREKYSSAFSSMQPILPTLNDVWTSRFNLCFICILCSRDLIKIRRSRPRLSVEHKIWVWGIFPGGNCKYKFCGSWLRDFSSVMGRLLPFFVESDFTINIVLHYDAACDAFCVTLWQTW